MSFFFIAVLFSFLFKTIPPYVRASDRTAKNIDEQLIGVPGRFI